MQSVWELREYVKILSLRAQQEQIALALHLGILSMAIWMLVLPAVLRRRSVEELEHAKARGAKIYGEIVGYGATGDAYHMTAPCPDGDGAARAIRLAMDEAGITPEQVDYINAHGTSTHANDAGETAAIKLALGDAAAKVAVKALEEGFLPPTINYHTPDEECDLDYIPNEGRVVPEAQYALSNSLGFGGHNGVLCFKKWDE